MSSHEETEQHSQRAPRYADNNALAGVPVRERQEPA